MSKRLSIIIPTHNRADSLPKVLANLASQEEVLKDAEIIVVDDGSTDSTKTIIDEFKKCFLGNFYYFYQSNKGASTARNLGIREAHGEIILFLDSDTVPSDELIPEHLKFHEKYRQDNFVLRGAIKFYGGKHAIVRFTSVPEIHEINSRGEAPEYIELCWGDFRSSNVSVKRKFLLERGVFDEEMCAYQDLELGYRLGKKGVRLFHSNKAAATHFHSVNLDQYFSYARKYGRALAIWYSKAPGLRKDLIKIKQEHLYGFFSWRSPALVFKHVLKLVLVNRGTVNLFISFGNILRKKGIKRFGFFYRQAYQYYRRREFLIYLSLIRRDDIRINKRNR